MKVVIIEDEFLTAQRLDSMINKYDAAIEVQAILPSVSDAVTWFKNNPDPDLIFMDIHLEDGQSFSIFETINLEVPVIFTTAYDEYMIKAFKVNSVDYLMKPINYEELVKAIDKYKKFHEHPAEEQDNMSALIQAIQSKETLYKERFLISVGSRLKTVELAEVQYFYSAEKITFLVTKDNQRYPVDYSLDKLVLMLNPKDFFRINRQMIVKLQAISNIHVYPKGKLKVDLIPAGKEEVFISLDKVAEFKEWLGK
ncbi:LytR/AlgR family response regulator transcription factor [Ferruginibacter profundus]